MTVLALVFAAGLALFGGGSGGVKTFDIVGGNPTINGPIGADIVGGNPTGAHP